MDQKPHPILIGVDGGGTSCRIALLAGARRHEIKLGRANVSTDRAAAVQTIRQGLDEIAGEAGISPEELAATPAYLGLAGVIAEDEAAYVASHLPFRTVRVEDDRPSAVVGAMGRADGTVAGIGTGSFMARQVGDSLRLIGGWGFAIGDEASGAWLGRHLLAGAMHCVDGLRPSSPLSEALLAEMGGAPGLVRFSLTAAARDFGQFAPRILDAARQGDTLATDLMRAGADYIARGADALGWKDGEPFCLIGGLAPHYAPYLPPGIAAALRDPQGNALDGTLILASRLAAEQEEEN